MKRIFSLVALTLVLSGLAVAQTNKKVEEEVLKLEKEWFEAYLRSDVDTVDRIEADDFLVITATSQGYSPKERQMSGIRSRTEAVRKRLASVTRSLDQVKIRTYENVAIINGINIQTRPDDTGKTSTTKAVYTSVWMKREGRWRVVNSQFTDLPEPKPPSGN